MTSGLQREELSYFFRGHIFEILAHHDAPELGFDEALSPFPFGWPGREGTFSRPQKDTEPEVSVNRNTRCSRAKQNVACTQRAPFLVCMFLGGGERDTEVRLCG